MKATHRSLTLENGCINFWTLSRVRPAPQDTEKDTARPSEPSAAISASTSAPIAMACLTALALFVAKLWRVPEWLAAMAPSIPVHKPAATDSCMKSGGSGSSSFSLGQVSCSALEYCVKCIMTTSGVDNMFGSGNVEGDMLPVLNSSTNFSNNGLPSKLFS